MANELNRRDFLVRTAAVAGATTGAALMQACMPVTAPAEEAAGPQMAEPVKLTLWQGSWLWDEYFPHHRPQYGSGGHNAQGRDRQPAHRLG